MSKEKENKEAKVRAQSINLESGLEVVINHASRHKCEKCGEEVIWALIQVELVSLARWDIHKCKIVGEILA